MESTVPSSSGLSVRWKRNRNWAVVVLSFASVVLLVTSIIMPRWLERHAEFVQTKAGEQVLSSALRMGLFRVCESNRLRACFSYDEATKGANAKVLWDVQPGLTQHMSQFQVARVSFVLAMACAALATILNALMPSREKCLRWLIGRATASLLNVLFTTLSVIIWFYWSGRELRRSYSPQHLGGRLSPGPSFYLAFTSAVFGAMVSCFNLYQICRSPTGVQRQASVLENCSEEEFSDHRVAMARSFGVMDTQLPVREVDFPPPYCKDNNDNFEMDSCRAPESSPPLYEAVCLFTNDLPSSASFSSASQLPPETDTVPVATDTIVSQTLVVFTEDPPAYSA